MLRSLVERATSRTVLRRRLPSAFGGGRICVSGSAGLRYLFRSMENVDANLLSLAKEFVQKNSVVWDVGANIGLFTFAAAHVAGSRGRVYSLEPDAWLVQLLRRSAASQPRSSAPVEVIPVAAAGSCALRTFNIAVRSRSASFLAGYGSSQTGGIAERQTVVSVSLDWLGEHLPPPDVVKIDVEGAEAEVFEGSLGLLARKRPVILCEVASEGAREVSALLRGQGYRLYDGEAASGKRRELETATWTTIAVPA